MTVVEASLHHLDVVLGYCGFLGELLAQEIIDQVEVTVEQPAHQSEGEHVAAFQHRLVVHAAVGQTVFHHLRDGTSHHTVGVDAHLAQVVIGLESRLLQVVRTETVGINDDGGLGLGIAVLCLERRGVHRHEHVAQVTRGIDLTLTNMHLKSRHTGERPLRGADVCRIIRKCGDAVTY